MTKRIVICSGKINRHGYKVVASGIHTASYERNPVLLFQHNSAVLSIGKMKDLRIEDVDGREALTGMPEFDMQDPLGAMVANKYERGYLSSCSMGHAPLVTSSNPEDVEQGQIYETVMETELLEVSMTNVPGDRDAVVLQLSNGQAVHELRKLININHKTEKMELTKISNLLGLGANASEKEILEAIGTLQLSLKSAQAERVKSLMELGVINGHVTNENRQTYEVLATSNYDEVASLLSAKVETYEHVAVGGVVTAIKAMAGVSDTGKSREELSFDKLSRENPTELLRIQKEEPELYKKLAMSYVTASKTVQA